MKIVTITTISKRKFDFYVKDDVCHKTLINNIKSEGIILEDNNKTTAINPDYIETIEIEPNKAESDLKDKDAFQAIINSVHSLGGSTSIDSKGNLVLLIGGKVYGHIPAQTINDYHKKKGYTYLNI